MRSLRPGDDRIAGLASPTGSSTAPAERLTRQSRRRERFDVVADLE